MPRLSQHPISKKKEGVVWSFLCSTLLFVLLTELSCAKDTNLCLMFGLDGLMIKNASE